MQTLFGNQIIVVCWNQVCVRRISFDKCFSHFKAALYSDNHSLLWRFLITTFYTSVPGDYVTVHSFAVINKNRANLLLSLGWEACNVLVLLCFPGKQKKRKKKKKEKEKKERKNKKKKKKTNQKTKKKTKHQSHWENLLRASRDL